MRDLQRDAIGLRAALFAPTMLDAWSTIEAELGDAGADALDTLADWHARSDLEMRPGSRAALPFERFLTHYRETVVHQRLAGLLPTDRDPSSYDGDDWMLLGLSPDSAGSPTAGTPSSPVFRWRVGCSGDSHVGSCESSSWPCGPRSISSDGPTP